MTTVEDRKKHIEKVFEQVGVKAVTRRMIDGEEVFLADGFISPTLINQGYLIKFKVEPGEFPFGCFLTLWWTTQNKGMGSVAVFDAMHDPGYSSEEKQKMRIASTLALAKRDFKRRKMH